MSRKTNIVREMGKLDFHFQGHLQPSSNGASGYAAIAGNLAMPQWFIITGWMRGTNLLMAQTMAAIKGFGLAEEIADGIGIQVNATGFTTDDRPLQVHNAWAKNRIPRGEETKECLNLYTHMLSDCSKVSMNMKRAERGNARLLLRRCGELARMAAATEAEALVTEEGWTPCDSSLTEATEADMRDWDTLFDEIRTATSSEVNQGPMYRVTADGIEERKSAYQELADRLGREFAELLINREHVRTIQDIEKTRRRMAEMARTSPPTPGVSGITLRRIGGRTYFEEPT